MPNRIRVIEIILFGALLVLGIDILQSGPVWIAYASLLLALFLIVRLAFEFGVSKAGGVEVQVKPSEMLR